MGLGVLSHIADTGTCPEEKVSVFWSHSSEQNIYSGSTLKEYSLSGQVYFDRLHNILFELSYKLYLLVSMSEHSRKELDLTLKDTYKHLKTVALEFVACHVVL